jgi:hypothetical protein
VLPAGKPKEAIDMYIHNQDWESAMRVAEQYDPSSAGDILIAQARFAAERKQHGAAESLFLKAKRPELALEMYKGLKMWHDALRLAEDYLPSKVRGGLNRSRHCASRACPSGERRTCDHSGVELRSRLPLVLRQLAGQSKQGSPQQAAVGAVAACLPSKQGLLGAAAGLVLASNATHAMLLVAPRLQSMA